MKGCGVFAPQIQNAKKFLQVNSKMITKDSFVQVVSLFNVKQQLICLSFGFRPQTMAEEMKMEIEGDEHSFSTCNENFARLLTHYSGSKGCMNTRGRFRRD